MQCCLLKRLVGVKQLEEKLQETNAVLADKCVELEVAKVKIENLELRLNELITRIDSNLAKKD